MGGELPEPPTSSVSMCYGKSKEIISNMDVYTKTEGVKYQEQMFP
jgi:hypothetical protein